MKIPKVTIVTVVLNDQVKIESTIQSVINQTYNNLEYIIVDGGSEDGTLDIIKKYKNHLNFLITEPDKGIYDAMNKGARLSDGDWILFLNSGDQLSNHDVLYNIFAVRRNDILENDVIYSDVVAVSKSGTKIRKAKSLSLFWRGLPFSHQSVLVRTSLAKNRPFNNEYQICADYDFFYSIYNNKAKFYYVDFPIGCVDITTGLSKNVRLNILYKEYFRVCRQYNSSLKILIIFFMIAIEYFYAIVRRYSLKAL